MNVIQSINKKDKILIDTKSTKFGSTCTMYLLPAENQANFKLIGYFDLLSNLCSSTTVKGFYIENEDYKEDIKQYLSKCLEGRALVVSFQNMSKTPALVLLELGFKDIFRLPGNYTSSAGSYISVNNEEGKKDCLSFLVKTRKDLTTALVKTKELITPLLPKEVEVKPEVKVEKEIVKEVIDLPEQGYLCKNKEGTKGLTTGKVYFPNNVLPGIIYITNDLGKNKAYKAKRFEKVIF